MKLEDLLKLAREFGVSEMNAKTDDAGEVKFLLNPHHGVDEKPLDEDVDEMEKQMRQPEEPKRGKDGLTEEQQESLYGKKMSDTQK